MLHINFLIVVFRDSQAPWFESLPLPQWLQVMLGRPSTKLSSCRSPSIRYLLHLYSSWRSSYLNLSICVTESTTEVYLFGGVMPSIQKHWFAASTVTFINVTRDGTLISFTNEICQMPEPRYYHCVIPYNDRYVFIIGGMSPNLVAVTTARLFDSETLSFVNIFNTTKARLGSVCDVVNDKIIIAGGATLTN